MLHMKKEGPYTCPTSGAVESDGLHEALIPGAVEKNKEIFSIMVIIVHLHVSN
jgi:hypothetical protein